MTNALSTISGQFGKALILGTFAPVALFAVLGYIFVAPLAPLDWAAVAPLQALDPQWKLLVVLFVIVVLSALLYDLNSALVRLFEGYSWKDSPLGRWRARHYAALFKAASARQRGLPRVLSELVRRDVGESVVKAVAADWNEIGVRLNTEFPNREDLVLPTRLGNVIRSFEVYPGRQYGMEAIVLWPRLAAVADKEYLASIDDTKTAFDFMLNSAALSVLVAAAILVVGLRHAVAAPSGGFVAVWLLAVAGFLVLSYLFYLGSIPRAAAWGAMVKAAFDLYRARLLGQLGYQATPLRADERRLWDAISQQTLFGDLVDTGLNDESVILRHTSAAPVALARGRPDMADLEVARGVSRPDADGAVTVSLCVTHRPARAHSDEGPVTEVVVFDTLPDGFAYEWGSQQVDSGGDVRVAGANPYAFYLGSLDWEQSRLLTYRILPRKGG